jgi:hypothetical protein
MQAMVGPAAMQAMVGPAAMQAMVGPAVQALFTGDVVLGTSSVAILCKYYKMKWAKARTGSMVKGKLREARPYVLRSLRLLAALALAKASFKANFKAIRFVSTYLLIFVKSSEKPKQTPPWELACKHCVMQTSNQ